MSAHDAELDRIRREYERRDAGRSGGPSWGYPDPAYVLYVQELERALLDAVHRSGVELASARVLEVGCGAGAVLHRFVDFGAAHAAGIDLMEQRVEEGRRLHPELELRCGDAARLPWDDALFDVAMQVTCLSSVLDPALRTEIAAEMWRVLRPGGIAVSYDMRPAPAPLALLRDLLRRSGALAPPPTPIEGLSRAELARLFPEAPLHVRSLQLHTSLGAVARRSRAAAVALRALPPLRSHLLAVAAKPPAGAGAAPLP